MLNWKEVTVEEFIKSVSEKDAIIISRDLFQWLSDNPDKEKTDYPNDIFLPFIKHSTNRCALCSICVECINCVMYEKWWSSIGEVNKCTSIYFDTVYNFWRDSRILYDRSFFALLMVENFNYVLDTEYGGEFNIEDVT